MQYSHRSHGQQSKVVRVSGRGFPVYVRLKLNSTNASLQIFGSSVTLNSTSVISVSFLSEGSFLMQRTTLSSSFFQLNMSLFTLKPHPTTLSWWIFPSEVSSSL